MALNLCICFSCVYKLTPGIIVLRGWVHERILSNPLGKAHLRQGWPTSWSSCTLVCLCPRETARRGRRRRWLATVGGAWLTGSLPEVTGRTIRHLASASRRYDGSRSFAVKRRMSAEDSWHGYSQCFSTQVRQWILSVVERNGFPLLWWLNGSTSRRSESPWRRGAFAEQIRSLPRQCFGP